MANPDPCQVYTQAFTLAPGRSVHVTHHRGHAMTTLRSPHRGRAARRPRLRRAADRRRRALPRRVRRGRHLRLAPHGQPLAGHRRVGGAAGRAVRHARCSTSRSRRGPRTSRTSSSRSSCCATASPNRPISELTRIGTVEGFGAMLRHLPMPDFDACLRRGRHGHGHRPPRQRPVRGPRPRRGRLRGRGRPRPHVVRRPRHRLREPGHRGRDRQHAGPHGHRHRPRRRPSSYRRSATTAKSARVLPDDIDFTLEMVVGRMIGLLLIEISAFHGFTWAEAVLSDTDLLRRRRRGGPHHLLHPGRRDPPRRLPADGAVARCATAPGSATAARSTTAPR